MTKNLAREIFFKAKKNVWTNNTSDNLSKIRGSGLDFLEIREYQNGDDFRKINHKASAKTGQLQTNVFNESRQISFILAVPITASLLFGSQQLKIEKLAEIIANHAIASITNKNQTKVILYADDFHKIANIKTQGDILKLVEEILQIDLLKKTVNTTKFISFLQNQQKSIITLISDFYQTYDLAILAKKHQLSIIMLRDKLEENPNFRQNISLVNAENNANNSIFADNKFSKKYQQKLKELDHKLFKDIRKYQIDFIKD